MTHGGNVWQGASPGEWLDYSANTRPGGAPGWVREALAAAVGDVPYYPDPDAKRAREGLAGYLGLPPECVCPTAGGISALDLAMRLPADDVLLPAPCFTEYAALAARHEKRVRTAPLLGDSRAILPPTQALRGHFAGAGIVCIGNPVNPLGTAFGRGEMAALLGEVEARRGWLVVDEAFIEYCPQRSVRGMIAAHERLIVAGSMTKVLGIPGARLGYLCAQPLVLARLREYQLPWELNCFAGAIARELPGHAEALRAEAAMTSARRAALARGLKALGALAYPSEAPFLLARFDRPVSPVAAALRAKGILVRECMDFEGIDDGRHLRLAVKDGAANARLLAALEEALRCAENR